MALAHFFAKQKIGVELWDKSPRSDFIKSSQNLVNICTLEEQGVTFCFDAESKTVKADFALLVPSPGISPRSELFNVDGVSCLPKLGELELGIQLFAEGRGARQIVITGSNGKSTTTALIHHILKSTGFNSVLCGNIGEPVIEKLPDDILDLYSRQDLILTVEASSYQLENCEICKPDVAVMLNLTENHLERHGNISAYLEAKKNLVRRFDSNSTLVVNSDDAYSKNYSEGIAGVIRQFGSTEGCAAQIDFDSGQIGFIRDREIVYSQRLGCLIGAHNLYNISAALLACQSVGCDLKSAIQAAYRFEGLEHRLEQVLLASKFLAINDSKATTVSASIAACKAVVESGLQRKIILLLGGVEKAGSDWTELVKYINQYPEAFEQLWLFGECAEKLKAIFETRLTTRIFNQLASTAQDIKSALTESNLLLLTPGCASFDEFTDFEDRGRFFKGLLRGLYS